jgi:aminoglycoside 3-N-acetyltransferase
MLKWIDRTLKRVSPSLHAKLKGGYRAFKKKSNPKATRQELLSILRNELKIVRGDVVFVHSSMRSLYLDFDKTEILAVLKEAVGEEGTLVFPCWHFNIRAEEFIKEHDPVFDIINSPSAMGRIPDELRKDPGAFRSFHPTNSVVAIGPRAEWLTKDHETGVYPCGEQSPFYKLIALKAKVIGIGVTVDNLTFVHTVEDTMKDSFPVKTRNEEVFSCSCVDEQGKIRIVQTLVASLAIQQRDVFGFFRKHVPASMYRFVKIKGMDFFSLDAPAVFEQLKKLARENKTIYSY